VILTFRLAAGGGAELQLVSLDLRHMPCKWATSVVRWVHMKVAKAEVSTKLYQWWMRLSQAFLNIYLSTPLRSVHAGRSFCSCYLNHSFFILLSSFPSLFSLL
jgi:hypothetical protein